MPPDHGSDSASDRRDPQPRDRERTDPDRTDEPRGERRRRTGERFSAWLASAAVRFGLTLIGIVVLVFALGQAVGLDLLGLLAEAVTSETGRWLVVAFFALLLVAVAQRGIAYRS